MKNRALLWLSLVVIWAASACACHAQTNKPCPIYETRDFTIYFPPASAKIDADGKAVVAAFADYYKAAATSTDPCWPAMKMARVSLKGHTDTVGAPDDNERLALRRAETVADAFVNLGIPKDIITVESAGEDDLAVSGGDEFPEPLNRRVTIDYNF